jgi:hypothetical protein
MSLACLLCLSCLCLSRRLRAANGWMVERADLSPPAAACVAAISLSLSHTSSFYVFLPPLLLDAAVRVDWFVFKKVR